MALSKPLFWENRLKNNSGNVSIHHMWWTMSSIVTTFHNTQKGLPGLAVIGFLTESQKILNKFSHMQLYFIINTSYYFSILLGILQSHIYIISSAPVHMKKSEIKLVLQKS